MKWTDLQYVLSIARAGSVRGAAHQLGVNHATLSRHLRDLQEELGVRLFERQGRRLEISASGRELLEVLEEMDEKVVGVCRRLAGRDSGLTGDVCVALPWTLARVLTPWLPDFAARFDGIRLRLSTGLDFASLARREADIAVRVADQPLETLVGRRVGELTVAAYGAHDLLDALEPCQAADYPWVGWDERRRGFPMEVWLRAQVPGSKRRFIVDVEDALFALVQKGVGVGFIADALADQEPGLRRVKAPTPVFSSSIWVLTHEDQRVVPRIRATTDWLAHILTTHIPPRP